MLDEPPVDEGDRADDQNDDGDRIAELFDLEQQRGFEGANSGEHLVDAPQFGVGAGGDDHSGRPARDDQCARIGHACAVADGRVGRDRLGRFVRGHGLAGQRRFFRAQVLDLDQPQIGWDLVAGFKEHDVARHELLRRDHRGLAVAQGSRLRREHVADRIERLLRPAFLNESEQAIDDHHRENDRRVQPQAHHQLDEPGGDEDIDEDIVELLHEAHERPALARGRQQVEAIFRLAPRGFSLVEASLHAALEPLDRLVRREGVPGGWLCCAHSSGSVRKAAARSRCATARQA